MAKQEQATARSSGSRRDEATTPAPAATGEEAQARIQERGGRLRAAIGDLIDEIDEVLEENAEEFVRSYVQRGGE